MRISDWSLDVCSSDLYYFTPELKQILGSGLLNPFLLPGQEQSAESLAALQAVSARGVQLYGGESTSTILDATFAVGLGFELPGGEVQAAVGWELRSEASGFTGPALAPPVRAVDGM